VDESRSPANRSCHPEAGGIEAPSRWDQGALRFVKIEITSNPGETFLDRMIALVEGAKRQEDPNESRSRFCYRHFTLSSSWCSSR